MKKILSIGSVVLLKGGTKKVMIIGYFGVSNEHQNQMYDYSGCVYPEGLLDSEQTLLFNDDQIQEVCFEGYASDEQKEFFQKLNQFYQSLENDDIELLDTDEQD